MADEQSNATVQAAEQEGSKIVEQSFAEQIVERDRRIADLERQFSESETARTSLAETVAAMRAEQMERSFREEVEGRSADNGVRYQGDLDQHIDMLKSLPDDKRQVYMEMQRNQAKAARAFAVKPERGSDAFHETDSAEAEANRKAEELRKTKPELTHAQAFTEVVKAEPGLKKRYDAERNTRPQA